jgi:hypothetical protein
VSFICLLQIIATFVPIELRAANLRNANESKMHLNPHKQSISSDTPSCCSQLGHHLGGLILTGKIKE